METIIGFAAGYLAGAKDGKAGLERLRTSLEAIVKSPEVRRLGAEGVTLAGTLVRRTSARGIGASASGIAELVMRRVSDKSVTKRRD
jgi:hypothetical protein